MPRNNNINLKRGIVTALAGLDENGIVNTTPKYINNSSVEKYNILSISLSGSYIRVDYSTTGSTIRFNQSDPFTNQTLGINGCIATGGTYNGGTYDSNILDTTYQIISVNKSNNYFIVYDATAYAVLSGGAVISGSSYLTTNNPFTTGITNISVSSGSIRFDFIDINNIYKPDVGDEICLETFVSTSTTVNFNKSYIVTFVDKINNYFLATDATILSALNSGVTITSYGQAYYVINKTGEFVYSSDTNSFVVDGNNLIKNNYTSNYIKSVPIKFTSGRNYYTPFNGGNLSTLTMAVNNFYFVPFFVPNTMTFSSATLSTKTNTSSNIGFAIYADNFNSNLPNQLLVSGGGTSATTWSLASTNTNIVNNTYQFEYNGLVRNTSGLQLPKGCYFLCIINRTAGSTLTPNSGVSYGVLTDTQSINFFPPGCLVNTTQGATSTVFPDVGYAMAVSTAELTTYDATVREVPLIYLTAV